MISDRNYQILTNHSHFPERRASMVSSIFRLYREVPDEADRKGLSGQTAPNEVKDRLLEIGLEGLTVAEVRGFGRQKGRGVYRGAEYNVDFLPKLHLTIIATDEQVPEIMDAIIEGARTGKIGDGKILRQRD